MVLGGSGGISRGGVKALVPADARNLKDVKVITLPTPPFSRLLKTLSNYKKTDSCMLGCELGCVQLSVS